MRLIELVACTALVLCFALSCCGILYSYRSLSAETAGLRRELEHDSFVVRGVRRAAEHGTTEQFLSVCRGLWPDEELSLHGQDASGSDGVLVCEWTHEGKRKSVRVVRGGGA